MPPAMGGWEAFVPIAFAPWGGGGTFSPLLEGALCEGAEVGLGLGDE